MAYKWGLNGYEIGYLSKPKPNHYLTKTILKTQSGYFHGNSEI